MTTDQKNEIAELANQYITENKLTASKLSLMSYGVRGARRRVNVGPLLNFTPYQTPA